ncbi:hypothetical protein GCM10022222_85060 [Amycolatopsis ultiminotia]|uniref:ABC transporter-associated repeat protein n=1 Tax=Amycolatopsis ultiminotia TaxID=543629 RepID=A0ABP6YNL3_9PSEU
MPAPNGILRHTFVVCTFFTASALVPSAVADAATASLPANQLAVVTAEDDTVRVWVADGDGGALLDPAGVVLHAQQHTAMTDGAGGLPDWDTTSLPSGEAGWTLDSVQGPGRFRAYTVEDGLQVPRFDSSTMDSARPETYAMPAGRSGDFGWVFDAPGRYRVAFTVSATLASGRSVSAPAIYTVDVAAETSAVPDQPAATSPAPEHPRTENPVPAAWGHSPAQPPAQAGGVPTAAAAGTGDTASGHVVLGEGHVDALAPRIVGNKFQIQVKDSTQAGKVTWRRPADVVFQVRPAARFPLPDNDKLSFAGKPGDLVYLIPQVQQDGVIWAGWSTEALTPQQIAGSVSCTLTSVQGPAPVAIFTTGTFGDEKLLLGNAPGTPTAMQVPLATHAHANWIFPKEGIYRLTFALTAKQAGGSTYTDTQTYGFAVGNADPEQAFGPGTPTNGTGGTAAGQDQRQPGSAGAPDSGGNDRLAYTGFSAVLPLSAGGAMLVAGSGLVFFASRRRARVGDGR